MKIGFIGAGGMGSGMVRSLLRAGHQVTVWNRSPDPARALQADGATVAAEAGDVAAAEIVITMLADDHAVEAVVTAPAFMTALGADTVHVMSATISVALAERLTVLHAVAGRAYVSAPVFGRPPAAATAQLFVVAAVAAAALTRCEPVFAAIGRRTVVVGPTPRWCRCRPRLRPPRLGRRRPPARRRRRPAAANIVQGGKLTDLHGSYGSHGSRGAQYPRNPRRPCNPWLIFGRSG